MPLFLVIEGPDGGGKSTQVKLLAEWLRKRGYAVTTVREPGGTALGEAIRHIILDPCGPASTPLAMAFLMEAARAQIVEEVIRPALARNEIVIADRFAASTVVYQGIGLGVDVEAIAQLNRIATGGLEPDAVIFLDVPAQVGLERTEARGKPNRLDQQSLDFHQRVHAGYLTLAREQGWIAVDGRSAPERVQRAIIDAIEPLLEGIAQR